MKRQNCSDVNVSLQFLSIVENAAYASSMTNFVLYLEKGGEKHPDAKLLNNKHLELGRK